MSKANCELRTIPSYKDIIKSVFKIYDASLVDKADKVLNTISSDEIYWNFEIQESVRGPLVDLMKISWNNKRASIRGNTEGVDKVFNTTIQMLNDYSGDMVSIYRKYQHKDELLPTIKDEVVKLLGKKEQLVNQVILTKSYLNADTFEEVKAKVNQLISIDLESTSLPIIEGLVADIHVILVRVNNEFFTNAEEQVFLLALSSNNSIKELESRLDHKY